MNNGSKSKQYIAALAATIGSFGLGTAVAWTSPALPYLSSNCTNLEEPMTPEEGAWVGSLLAIGAILGSIPTGRLADRFGRKWTIIGLGFPSLMSWLMIIFGKSVWIIYVARLVSGMSIGGYSVVIPMYIGEIAEVSIRGMLGSFFEIQLCFGVLYTYAIGATVNYLWLGLFMMLVPMASITIFFFMPESPTYLMMKGRRSSTEQVLRYFRGTDVTKELQLLEKQLQKTESDTMSLKELLKSQANVSALVVGLGLMFAQQMSGVNIVIFYTADLFQAAGSQLSPDLCAIIIGLVKVFSTFIALALVDRAGRRVMLLCSAISSTLSLAALGIFFQIKTISPETAETLGWLPLTAANLFIVAMAIGLAPIPWIMQGELYSSAFKGWATSAVSLFTWSLVFFVTKTFINLVDAFTVAGTFFTYAIITFLCAIFIFFKVPETQGKYFIEIQTLLASR